MIPPPLRLVAKNYGGPGANKLKKSCKKHKQKKRYIQREGKSKIFNTSPNAGENIHNFTQTKKLKKNGSSCLCAANRN